MLINQLPNRLIVQIDTNYSPVSRNSNATKPISFSVRMVATRYMQRKKRITNKFQDHILDIHYMRVPKYLMLYQINLYRIVFLYIKLILMNKLLSRIKSNIYLKKNI